MNDTSSHQQKPDTKKPVGFFAILHWLARLILLTEEEQDAAGIYFGSRDHDDNKN
jgi:hypothetical protein